MLLFSPAPERPRHVATLLKNPSSACFRIKVVSRANRTLLPSVWGAAAVPASVLTAARKLKYSWILARIPVLICLRLSDTRHPILPVRVSEVESLVGPVERRRRPPSAKQIDILVLEGHRPWIVHATDYLNQTILLRHGLRGIADHSDDDIGVAAMCSPQPIAVMPLIAGGRYRCCPASCPAPRRSSAPASP